MPISNSLSPELRKLIRVRSYAIIGSSVFLISLLLANFTLFSSASKLGAMRIWDDSPITISLLVSTLTIVASAMTTISYIIYANVRVDKIAEEVVSKLAKAGN